MTADVGGAVLSVALAVLVFARFSIHGILSRDESIYAYAGQQLQQGVAPYASIFDPKTPLAAMLSGLGAALAAPFGADDVLAMRLVFFVFACLAVAAVYWLALELWGSPVAALVTAVVFAVFRGFALDALTGPNAKTPGIFFAVLAMALTVRRQWLTAGLAGALAFLVWQPLLVYLACTAVLSLVLPPRGQRGAALARTGVGAAVPLVLTAAYFTVVGRLGDLLTTAFVFPVIGIRRGGETVVQRLHHIASVVHADYGVSGVLFWLGTVLLVAAIAARLLTRSGGWRATLTDPLVAVVGTTFAGVVLFSASDFQGYPDLYPLLPYAAVGCGAAAASVLERVSTPAARRAATAAGLAGVLVLTAVFWVAYGRVQGRHVDLVSQQRDACTLNRVLGPQGRLQSLGDPRPLVLTHRRNPTRFIYLGSGIARWHVDHLPAHLRGWEQEIRSASPDVVITKTWHGVWHKRMTRWLRANYSRAVLGRWHLFLAPPVLADAQARGITVLPPAVPGGPARVVSGSGSGRC
jgi:4-amino-4-deoxy-L-arabinose transferase-like glycosyltransferase